MRALFWLVADRRKMRLLHPMKCDSFDWPIDLHHRTRAVHGGDGLWKPTSWMTTTHCDSWASICLCFVACCAWVFALRPSVASLVVSSSFQSTRLGNERGRIRRHSTVSPPQRCSKMEEGSGLRHLPFALSARTLCICCTLSGRIATPRAAMISWSAVAWIPTTTTATQC